MILETMLAVTDWLADEDTGVNALLREMPVDPEFQVPEPVRLVVDEARTDWAAAKSTPPASPAIVVTMDAPFEMQRPVPTGQHRESEDVTLAIRYIRSDYQTARAVRDTLVTLRAIVKSLADLMANVNEAARTRNDVCIVDIPSITQLLVLETVGDSSVTGAVLCQFEVRDIAP